jgi:DNA polymerase-3 subunit alpha
MCVFCPLHNHTEFSALDGLSTPREVAQRAVELGSPAVGITDHGTVAGHLEFAKEVAKHGIKPIFGSELYHGVKPQGYTNWTRNERDQSHFVVGAQTSEGLRNLWRLVDFASTNFRYVGRVTWEVLEQYNAGLFATSACIQGLVPQGIRDGDLKSLDRYLDIFGDRFYIELHTYPGPDQEEMNKALVQVAGERGIPVVYANDAHFAFPNQYQAHDAYVAMQTGQNVDTPLSERKMWHPIALYMMEEWEIRDSLHYLPESVVDEALNNSVLIAEQCDVELPEIKRHLPVFIPKDCPFVEDKSVSAVKLFIDLVEQGISARYGEQCDPEVIDRAFREMEVFLNAGLEHYFLQTWDFCQFCDEQGIVRGPGRGSAAGSLVAYALGITDVDPMHYGLIFERFFNPGREKGFPDIDNDFPQGDRKAVKDYLIKRWGKDKVRSIGTVTRMKPKAALDKTYGAMGVTFGEKEELKKIVSGVPDLEILDTSSIGWKDDGGGKTIYVMDHVGDDLRRWVERQPEDRQPILNRWLDFVGIVCSRVSGYGVHASGVVVSDTPLDAELPSGWSSNQETQATWFPMKDVELRQFVKQDILGLRTLDTLQDWTRQMRKQGVDVQWSGLERKDHPEEMWQLLDRGLATGIFQIEEKNFVRQLAMDFQPRSVIDLSIIVALNRPGPIRSGAPESFLARRRGEEPISYDHPILEDILHETYGWFLYQEQVIAFFSKLGYDLEEADAVRKILGKKKPVEMKRLYAGEGEWAGKGYRQIAQKAMGLDAAEVIWRKLEDFAKYSFNKSHSVAYATIAFRTLYAKYYAPAEFIMACMRTNPDEAGAYVAEGRRMGVSVKPPDIRMSDVDVEVNGSDIYFGLSNVKGIGRGTAAYVRNLVKQYDVYTTEQLQLAVETEQELWTQRRDRHKAEKMTQFKERSPRNNVRSNIIDLLFRIGAFDNYEERSYTLPEAQATEKELLGIILSDNTEEAFAEHADLVEQCNTYADLAAAEADCYTRLPGIITSVRKTKTKAAGNDMGIVSIEWGMDRVEFVVFPQQWQKYKWLWRERTPGIFKIKKTARGINFEDGIKLG